MASYQDIILQQLQNRIARQAKVKADREAAKTKNRKGIQSGLSLALSLATMGGSSLLSAGMKGLSKFDKLKKIIDASKGLQKAAKVLDVGSKTSRLGTYGAQFANKAINRLIADLLVEDTETMRGEDKLSGYGQDLAGSVAGYGKSFVKGAMNPVSSLPFDEPGAIPIDGIGGESIIDQGSISSIEPNLATGPTFSQQSSLNQQGNPFTNMEGFSTQAHQSKNILGNILSQYPSGYKPDRQAYYNIIDDLVKQRI